jgi:acetyl esterase/lipase
VDPRDVLERPAPSPDLVVRYAHHRDALVDVYLPPGIGRPSHLGRLLVLVHGGFWRPTYDRRHLRPMAAGLAADGWTVASVEYRRAAQGGWPAAAHDVVRAAEVVTDLVDAAAPGRIDPHAPFVISGHSAGGHLALWAGLRAGSRVERVVALAPVSDLAWAAGVGMGDGAVPALLGGLPAEQPAAYADADVIRHLDGRVAVTIVQGTADEQVAVEMNRRVAYDHPHVRYLELAGVDHFALIDPLSPAFGTVRTALLGP